MSYSLGLPYRVDGYLWTAKWVSTDAIQVFMIRTKTTDIGEKRDPLDVVFSWNEVSQPAVIAVKGNVFGWRREGRFKSSTRNHFGHTF